MLSYVRTNEVSESSLLYDLRKQEYTYISVQSFPIVISLSIQKEDFHEILIY